MEAMNWNPVLNKFVEIKNEFKRKFGYITYYYIDGYTNESQTCLERWMEQLNAIYPFNQYPEYTDLLSCLELNQYGDPKYLKLNQMGVKDYSTLFTQEEGNE